jgi:two-component system, NarL family, sensor histidine kinase DesK
LSIRNYSGVPEGVQDESAPGNSLEQPGDPARGTAKKRKKHGDLLDFIWIVYSIFFFIEPYSRHNTRYWLQFLAVYAVFATIYTGLVFARSKTQNYLLLAAMGVLSACYFPYNNGAGGMFVYVAAFVPFVTESLAICLSTFVALFVTIMTEGLLLHMSPWSWGFASFFCLIVGGTNLFTAQRVRANSKLEMAHEEIEQLAKLAERERIARDLHDVLGHTLSVIVLKAELAGRLFSRDQERAAAEIADVEMIARKALSEVREAIRGYRTEGLAAEIKRAHSTLDAAGVTLVCEEKPPALNPAEETVISLVLREAVTNVVRHAQASHCFMRFREQDGHASFIVEDDGRGGIRAEGNGLRGMRERIEALGGQFAISGASNGSKGTRLTIQLPSNGPSKLKPA